MEVRSFLAFELPKEIKEVLSRVSSEMKKTPIDLKWVKVDNIHLTVVFLGNVSTNLLEDMAAGISTVCRGHAPFPIRLEGSGIFFSRRRPTVLWIGLNGDMKRMADFRESLHSELHPFGIKTETRPFKPHLTLGRFRKGARSGPFLQDLMSGYEDVTSPAATLGELVLFKSDLKPGGAVYTRLNSWPLTAQ